MRSRTPSGRPMASPRSSSPGDFAMLRNGVGGSMPAKYKTIELEGDLDLFGDHSIEIHRTVSHTPGSQMMVVRLPKSGTAVLTSDAVYLQENLDKNILPSIGSVYNPPGMLDAYAWVRRVRDAEGAERLHGARSRWLQGEEALAGILRVSARQDCYVRHRKPWPPDRVCVGKCSKPVSTW